MNNTKNQAPEGITSDGIIYSIIDDLLTEDDSSDCIPTWSKRHPNYEALSQARKEAAKTDDKRYYTEISISHSNEALKESFNLIPYCFEVGFATLSCEVFKAAAIAELDADDEEKQEALTQIERLANRVESFFGECNDDGMVFITNKEWSLVLIDTHHNFTPQDIADVLNDTGHDGALMLGNSLGAVKVDGFDVSTLSTSALSQLEEDTQGQVQAHQVSKLILEHLAIGEKLKQETQDGLEWAKNALKGNTLDGFFEAIGADKSAYQAHFDDIALYINDPLREFGGGGRFGGDIDTYQIGLPSLMLFGGVDIYKNDYSFTTFDEVDFKSIQVVEGYIVFTGKRLVTANKDGAEEEVKRLFIVKNSDANNQHVFVKNSTEHQNNVEAVYSGWNAQPKEEVMCDYCNTLNSISADTYDFKCRSCSNWNQG